MKVKAKETIAAAAGKGILGALALTVTGAAIMSWMIIQETLKQEAVGYCAMGILLLSSMTGVLLSVKEDGTTPALVALASASGYYAVLITGNQLLYKGGYEGMGVTGVLILGGAMAGLLLKAKPRKNKYSPVRKIRHR